MKIPNKNKQKQTIHVYIYSTIVNLREFLISFFISRILIRMILQCQLPIRSLNLIIPRTLRHLQYIVIALSAYENIKQTNTESEFSNQIANRETEMKKRNRKHTLQKNWTNNRERREGTAISLFDAPLKIRISPKLYYTRSDLVVI